jgi:glycine C-acetyltransferase
MYRTLYSPQGGRIILDGREVINMASNNYLGLANHPAVVAAAKEALEKYGVATTASRSAAIIPCMMSWRKSWQNSRA